MLHVPWQRVSGAFIHYFLEPISSFVFIRIQFTIISLCLQESKQEVTQMHSVVGNGENLPNVL